MSTDSYDQFWNNVPDPDGYKAHLRRWQVEWTPRFCWFILPSIEINTSVKEVSFTFLCFGLYYSWYKK